MYRFIFFLLTFLISTNSYAQEKNALVYLPEQRQSILIENVNIFNGRDSILLKHQNVMIENGVITKLTSNPLSANPKEVQIINGSGLTLMPGFIDAHVHISGSGAVPWQKVKANIPYNLSAYLYAGITTVYDLGGIANKLNKTRKKLNKNSLLSPTLYHSHIPITVKNGHPIPLTQEMLPWPLKSMVNGISPTIKKTKDAPKIIRRYTKRPVDYVKIICDQIPSGSPEMHYDLLKALINETHKKDYKAFVHIGSPQNAVDAARAGADVLAHGIWRGKLSPEQADTIAKYNVPIIYTMAALYNVKDIYKGQYLPTSLDSLLVPQEILEPVSMQNGLDVKQQEVMHHFFEDVENQSGYLLHNFNLLHQRGVPILVGTDSALPGTYPGSTFIQELETLKKAGLSNYEILSGSTYLPSTLFLKNPNFGLIKQGNVANLLLLKSNPLENLSTVKSPVMIILKGQEIKRVK